MRRPFFLFLFASTFTGLAFACGGLIDPTDRPSLHADGGAAAPDPLPTSTPPSGPDAAPPPPPLVDAEPPPPTNVPVVIDLGTVTPGTDVTFTIPANALGFNVVLESASGTAVSPPDALGVERIASPSGAVVHDGFTPAGGDSPTSQSFDGLFVAAEVPQSESKAANPPEPGVWTARFAGPPGAPLHAEVRVQVAGVQGFVGGALDLRVLVPPGLAVDGKTVDATSAATDASIAVRIDAFFDALKDLVAIDRGAVTFQPVSATLRSITSEALLEQGFGAAYGSPPNEQSMKLLLTNAIDIDGDGAWGIAPGIPGAANRIGTTMSGIILSITDTPAQLDGLAVLHEMGHFIGLNHTTEFVGGYFDPLSDTPKCPNISIDDPSTITRCPDRANVMFPTITGFQIDVAPSQVAVYHGSPVYRAYGSPTMTTMSAKRAAMRPAATLAKSGRALTPVEAWLGASLCGHRSHHRADPLALVRALGRAEATAALGRARDDADLPSIVRQKAARALAVVTAAP